MPGVGSTGQAIGWPLTIGVALVVTLVYLSSLSGHLIADDWAMIDNNAERMRGIEAIQRFFTAGVWESSNLGRTDTALYRPVWLMWHFALYNLVGEDPVWWRVANLVLHIANTVLVASLLGVLLPGLTRIERALGALLFALHPAKTQSVAWISGSTDLLLTFFFLAAVLLFLRFRQTDRILTLAAVVGCYLGAMLTKEPGIVLPGVLLAIDLWWKGGRSSAGWRRSDLLVYGLFGIAALAFLWLRAFVLGGGLQGEAHIEVTGETTYRAFEYALAYLRLLVVPWPVPYYIRHVDAAVAGPMALAVGGAVLALLVIASWRSRMGRVGVVWFALSLAPPLYLAFHQLGLFGPRFLYLPSVGAVILAGTGLLWLKQRRRSLAAGFLPAAVVAFAVLTTLDLPNWRNELTWTQLAIRTEPTSRHGWSARAEHYLRTGEVDNAIEAWGAAAESVASDIDRVALLERIGIMEAERGRLTESMSAFERIATIPGSEAKGFIGVGNLHWTMRRREEALEAYDEALRHEPANALALANRARLSEALGDIGAAVAHYRRLLALPETPAFQDVRAHAERYVRRHAGR